MMLTKFSDDTSDGQFIFKEKEFEDDAFNAALFVTKYRRVSSLESLKEQLQQYSNALKQQLYNIINRDYKDFITISTKGASTSTSTSSSTSSSTPNFTRPVDLVAHGLLQPICQLLLERFPDMLSVGIPSTLSHCYRAVTRFLSALGGVAGPTYAASISLRLQSHPLVRAFLGRWKLDLYYQLRCKEVFSRVDRACSIALVGGLSAQEDVFKAIYGAGAGTGAGAGGAGGAGIGGGAGGGLASSVSAVDLRAIRAEVEAETQGAGTPNGTTNSTLSTVTSTGLPLQAALFQVFASELKTCLHPTVLLDPLGGRFLTLCLRGVLRLEAHVALSCNTPTPSFSPADLEELRGVYAPAPTQAPPTPSVSTSAPTSGSAGTGSAPATPAVKSRESRGKLTPVGTPSADEGAVGVGVGLPPLSLEELVLVCGGLRAMEAWLRGPLCCAAVSALNRRHNPSALQSPQSSLQPPSALLQQKEQAQDVRQVLWAQVRRLTGARGEVWNKATLMLGAECKRVLAAVKAVAGKYRMTNKPAPETASAYVAGILTPLRSFLEQHGDLAQALALPEQNEEKEGDAGTVAVTGAGAGSGAGLQRWLCLLLEDVSGSYAEQVRLLMDTVRQMEEALQRRAKLRTTGASGGASLTDSEKISLQIRLDVEAYAADIRTLGVLSSQDLPSLAALQALASE
ncbi:hypothetical protein B484DRAFT_445351 [Ochromonadaceae sp. CCMP2298]|nr:hypothetical protein B484DRAFT_445351 [Ochromonadaceae sp. CCMP2298]